MPGQLDLSRVGALLREVGVGAEQGDPFEVSVRLGSDGQARRVHASYDSGWSCVLRLFADGSYQLTRTYRVRLSGRLAA